MPRNFAASAKIETAAGNMPAVAAFGTIAAIIRLTSEPGSDCFVMAIYDSGTQRRFMKILNGGQVNDGSFSSALNVRQADGWQLLVFAKGNVNNTKQLWRYRYDTNAWDYETFGTAGNGTAAATRMILGCDSGGSALRGDMAVAGAWNRDLSDAEVRNLPFTLRAWHATAPDGLWLLDQDSISQPVGDLTGNGADQNALTGTTIGTGSVSVFGYGAAPILVPRPLQVYLISPSGTVTPAGTLVKRDNKVAAGTITPTGALIPLGVKPKSMSGTVTPAGALAQRANKALAGVITPVGILIKQGRKTLAGTLAPTGATAAFRVTLRAFSGVLAPTGALAKQLGKVAAGSITPAGVLAALKTTLLSLVGVLRPTAATVITGHIVPIVPNGLGVTVQTSDDHARRTTLETEG